MENFDTALMKKYPSFFHEKEVAAVDEWKLATPKYEQVRATLQAQSKSGEVSLERVAAYIMYFDYHYGYSDDPGVWRRGHDKEKQIKEWLTDPAYHHLAKYFNYEVSRSMEFVLLCRDLGVCPPDSGYTTDNVDYTEEQLGVHLILLGNETKRNLYDVMRRKYKYVHQLDKLELTGEEAVEALTLDSYVYASLSKLAAYTRQFNRMEYTVYTEATPGSCDIGDGSGPTRVFSTALPEELQSLADSVYAVLKRKFGNSSGLDLVTGNASITANCIRASVDTMIPNRPRFTYSGRNYMFI